MSTESMRGHRMLALARTLACTAHRGQEDKAGAPYIEHVLRVSAAGGNWRQKVLGMLHDIVEDTPMTVGRLALWFPEHIVNGVLFLSRLDPDESYDAYLDHIMERGDRDVIAVKLADLADNLNPERIPHPTPHDLARWAKYRAAQLRLQAALAALDTDHQDG